MCNHEGIPGWNLECIPGDGEGERKRVWENASDEGEECEETGEVLIGRGYIEGF